MKLKVLRIIIFLNSCHLLYFIYRIAGMQKKKKKTKQQNLNQKFQKKKNQNWNKK